MSKTMKSMLKEARDDFNQNDYKTAMEKCKRILKEDKKNYNALVLLGAAMREIDSYKSQASLILRKAIEVRPDNPLAWQGLVACYEKEPLNRENFQSLIHGYLKLLDLENDTSKLTSTLVKLLKLCLQFKDRILLNETLKSLEQLKNTTAGEKKQLLEQFMIQILVECRLIVNDNADYLMTMLPSLMASNVNFRKDVFEQYLKILHRSEKFDLILKECIEMHNESPSNIPCLEWICRVYYENTVLEKIENFEIEKYNEALLKLNDRSEIGILAQAAYLKLTKNFFKSRDCLNSIIATNPKHFYAWVILCEVNCELHCWKDVEHCAKEVMSNKKHTTEQLFHKIELMLIDALCESDDQEKLTIAREMCKKLLAKQPSTLLQLLLLRTKILLNDENIDPSSFKSEETFKEEITILEALHLKRRGCLKEAADILNPIVGNPEAWLLLGKIYWEMSDYNRAMMAFLNGVRIDVNHWECLVYLGHYYLEHGNNLERANKCYYTALRINPNSDQAGIGLSTSYRLLKNTDANLVLLRKVTAQGNGPKWALHQLGLMYLDQGNVSSAISTLQYLVRADPNDNHSWESLADAYWARGAYTSALKSYQQALELNPKSMYPVVQLANIKLLIGKHDEAKQDFQRILLEDNPNVSALKSFAETCIGLAKENTSKHFLGRARDNLEEAVDSLTQCITKRNDLSCVWKLLGDACYKLAIMPDKYCHLKVKSVLMKSDTVDEYMVLDRKDMFTLSSRSYCRALSLFENSAPLWYDLACCYYTQSNFVDSSIDQKDLINKSLAAAKHAIKRSPKSWLHWNILGVICMHEEVKNYALSQHCYIMAIDIELNNAVAWTNLGVLYLHLGNQVKANQAFYQAQRSDPAYLNSWIGQGLIAEKVETKETIELFKQAIELGYHAQGSLGYAHWVLTTILSETLRKDPINVYSIENMHAIPVACDVLNWYIEYNPNDVYALNAYGLLLERQKLYRSAEEQFSKALQLCNQKQKDLIRINAARVTMKLGRYKDSIQLCKAVKKKTFISQCQLALSLFKVERFEESYSIYETTLNFMKDMSSNKADILCAMAAMAYICQEIDDVKTLLFQCVKIEPPHIQAFLAAASLGMLHGDLNLTNMVLKELKPYHNHLEYRHHIITLSAYSHAMQNNVTNAIRVLSKAIHRYPNDVECWISLVRLLLGTNSNVSDRCAEKALFLGKNIFNMSIVHIACASSLSYVTTKPLKSSLRAVQKTVFSFPNNIESWANFITAVLPRSMIGNGSINTQWLLKLITILRKEWPSSQKMTSWLSNNEQMLVNSQIA